MTDTTKIMRKPSVRIVFNSVRGNGTIRHRIDMDNSRKGEAYGRLLRWKRDRNITMKNIEPDYWKHRSAILKGMG